MNLLSFFSRRSSAPVARERLQILLELANLQAERRLRDPQFTGGFSKVQRLGNRHEVPKVPQLHEPVCSRTDRSHLSIGRCEVLDGRDCSAA